MLWGGVGVGFGEVERVEHFLVDRDRGYHNSLIVLPY